MIELDFFDTANLSTASLVSCSNPICAFVVQVAAAECSSQSNQCDDSLQCSTCQSGDLTKTDRVIDGIIGFGQRDLSITSQLASRGITPKLRLNK
ncbi:hypothetical protein LOK49_LG01G03401 [Camellia lanceoleosa]|uniref:Uncharacterized protein n=1 Tax=Camellia lanceoleosa TaxID=1840588 RepID=A0ACC0IXV5_9ERIC|nr:hypothetical protein LOK49_LG01G03401 [Camellia lanceoleosa]